MSQKATIFLKNTLKAIIPLTIGILIFLWIYREIDIQAIQKELQKDIHYMWIIIPLLLVTLGHIIRAIRWKQLIAPLGKTPKTSNLIYAIFVNYLMNLILPRMGEVTRCAIISKSEKLPFSKVFGTLIIERIVDLLSLGIIIIISFSFKMQTIIQFLNQETEWTHKAIQTFSSIWLYIGLLALGILCWIGYKLFKTNSFVRKIRNIGQNILDGIKTIKLVKNKITFSTSTILMWIVYFLQFYLCFFAFQFTENLTFTQGLFIFVMANIGNIIPVQGGIGPWHFMVIHCMILFRIDSVEAATFALVVHGTQMIMTILLGIFGMIILTLNNKKYLNA